MIIDNGLDKAFDNGADYFLEEAHYNKTQAYTQALEAGTLENYYQEYPEERMLDYVEGIEKKLKKAEDEYARWLKKDKEQGCKATQKDIVRYKTLLSFAELGLILEGHTHVIIADKFEYVLYTGRWRVLGKNVWYWSKTPEQFYKKYVLKQEGF